MRPVTAGRVSWVVMPSKEFWPLLCHPCSLMSSSRKQKDSPTEKKWLWQSCDRFYEWFIYSLHPWCEKRKILLWLMGRCQHSSPVQIHDSQPWVPMEAVKRKFLLLQRSNFQPVPSTWLPNISLGTFPLVEQLPRPDLSQQWQWVKQGLPRDPWQPCREAADSNSFICALKVHHNPGNSLPILMSSRKSTHDAQGGLSEQHLCFLPVFHKYCTSPESWHPHLLREPLHSWKHGASWSSVWSLSSRIIPFWFKHLAEQKPKQNSTAQEAIQKKIQGMYHCMFPSQREIGPPLTSSPSWEDHQFRGHSPKQGSCALGFGHHSNFGQAGSINTFPSDRATASHNLHSVTVRAFGCLFFHSPVLGWRSKEENI